MDLNDTFKTRERTKFNGIEGLCLVCKRLAYPVRLYTLEKSYGRSEAGMSNIIHFMLPFLDRKFETILYLDVERIVPLLSDFCLANHKRGCLRIFGVLLMERCRRLRDHRQELMKRMLRMLSLRPQAITWSEISNSCYT